MAKAKVKKKEKSIFKGDGVGSKSGQRPVGTMLSTEVAALVRSFPNTSAFVREAVMEKLEREGLLPKAG